MIDKHEKIEEYRSNSLLRENQQQHALELDMRVAKQHELIRQKDLKIAGLNAELEDAEYQKNALNTNLHEKNELLYAVEQENITKSLMLSQTEGANKRLENQLRLNQDKFQRLLEHSDSELTKQQAVTDIQLHDLEGRLTRIHERLQAKTTQIQSLEQTLQSINGENVKLKAQNSALQLSLQVSQRYGQRLNAALAAVGEPNQELAEKYKSLAFRNQLLEGRLNLKSRPLPHALPVVATHGVVAEPTIVYIELRETLLQAIARNMMPALNVFIEQAVDTIDSIVEASDLKPAVEFLRYHY